MPNWKKVIVSGSSAELSELKLTDLSPQESENTTLVINSSGEIGTREKNDTYEVYRTGSSGSNIIPNKFGTFDNTGTNSVIASGDNNKISSNCSFIGGGS